MRDEVSGAALGVLIGLVSGFDLLFLLVHVTRRTKSKQTAGTGLGLKDLGTTVTQLLSIPTFWFGGPWLTGSVLHNINLLYAVPYYITTLAIVFGAIACSPLFRLLKFANSLIEAAPHRS
jgi:hypothetical protein